VADIIRERRRRRLEASGEPFEDLPPASESNRQSHCSPRPQVGFGNFNLKPAEPPVGGCLVSLGDFDQPASAKGEGSLTNPDGDHQINVTFAKV